MRFALALCAIALVNANPGPRCVSPRAWESHVNYWDPVTEHSVSGHFVYDSVHHRHFINEHRRHPGGSRIDDHFNVFALWQGREGPMVYSYNVNTTKCTKARISWPWRAFGVHPEAEFRRTVTIGTRSLPAAGVDVDVWTHLYRNAQGQPMGFFEEEFTTHGCIPVRQYFLNVSDPKHDYQEEHWYSTTLGIKNPNVFNPPRECFMVAEEVPETAISPDFKTWSMVDYHARPNPANAVVEKTIPSSYNPIPCVSPQQWEARTNYYDPITMVWSRSEISYDAVNQREYIFEQRETPMSTGDDDHFQIYAFWRSTPPKLFVYHVNTTQCVSTPLTTRFIPIGVPANATFRRAVTIGTNGLQDAGVEVNIWALLNRDIRGQPELFYEAQFTASGCIPVRQILVNFTRVPGQPADFQERHFHSVTAGIHNDRIFTLPAQCNNAIEVAADSRDPRKWSQVFDRAVA